MKVVAVFRNNFLPLSETFIHDELRFHDRYRPVVFARRTMNLEHFPGHEIVSLDGRPVEQAAYGLTAMSRTFLTEMERLGPAVIHAHFGHNGMYALPYARKLSIPLVVSFHGRDVSMLRGPDRLNPGWWHYTLRYKALFEQAALMLAASRELKALLTEAGAPEEKIVVHRLGIDVTRFTPRPLPQEMTLLMVGRLVEKKGFSYGLRAAARLISRGYPLRVRIVGDGPLRNQLQTLASALGIEDRVTFLGAVPHDTVLEEMKRAYVVATPSVTASNLDRESGLIVAKEAAAMAIPVVGTWHGGIPEIIEDGRTGFLVPERDWEALADAMARLLDDRDLAQRMGMEARRKMEREYDIKKANERLEELYDRCI